MLNRVILTLRFELILYFYLLKRVLILLETFLTLLPLSLYMTKYLPASRRERKATKGIFF